MATKTDKMIVEYSFLFTLVQSVNRHQEIRELNYGEK